MSRSLSDMVREKMAVTRDQKEAEAALDIELRTRLWDGCLPPAAMYRVEELNETEYEISAKGKPICKCYIANRMVIVDRPNRALETYSTVNEAAEVLAQLIAEARSNG